MRVASGTYTGDGTSGRDISVGWRPDVVIVKRASGANNAQIATSTMAGSKGIDASTIDLGRISALTADGFTVENDNSVNGSLSTYRWVAWEGDADDLAVFTYVGNNTDDRSVGSIGFTPNMAVVVPDAAADPYWRTDQLSGDSSQQFGLATQTNRIQAFESSGIQVGSSLNATGVTYHVICWKTVTGTFALTEYTGDGNDDREIAHGLSSTPTFVLVQSQSTNDDSVARYASHSGDLSVGFGTDTDAADQIQDMDATNIQVGTSARVNTNAVVYTLIAFAGEAGEPTLAVTGTITPSATEQEIRDGGKTIILTLTDGTWESTVGDCNEVTEALIDGLVSDQDEVLGWNNIVRGGDPYDEQVLEDTPLAYWRLDGLIDISGNSHDIDTVGSGVTQNVDSLLIRDSNVAMQFDGANAGLTITDAAAIQNIFDGGGTAEAIIVPFSDGEDDNGRIVSKGNVWALAIYQQSGGFARLYFRQEFSTTTGLWQTEQLVPLGVKSHVAVTYDSSSKTNDPTLYINGKPYTVANGGLSETSSPDGSATTDASEDIYIGGFGADVLRFKGQIDEVALYTSALTQTRIAAHLASASNPFGLTCADVVRTSDTVVTITMPPFPIYDITIDETITATAPANTHSGTNDAVGSPTFDIITDNVITGPFFPPGGAPGGSGGTDGGVGPGQGGGGGTGEDFGGNNGGLGPPAPGAEGTIGDGDDWVFGLNQLDVGLQHVGGPRGRLLRIEVAEISPTSD